MSFLDPQCEHERVGRVLAQSFSTAANATHILELDGNGKVEGLNLDQWKAIKANYRAEMDANLELHRTECK